MLRSSPGFELAKNRTSVPEGEKLLADISKKSAVTMPLVLVAIPVPTDQQSPDAVHPRDTNVIFS